LRILNNNQTPEEHKEFVFDIIPFLLYSFGCAVGCVSLFFAPISMILAFSRLPNPWSELSCVLGAVLALSFFGLPSLVIAVAFVLSFFCAYSVFSGWSVGKVFAGIAMLTIISSVVCIFALSNFQVELSSSTWSMLSDRVAEDLFQNFFSASSALTKEVLQVKIRTQGPILFLTMVLFASWLCIGFCSHFRFFPEGHPYESKSLRKTKFSKLLLLVIGFALLGGSLQNGLVNNAAWFPLLSLIPFMSGCLVLSNYFELKTFPFRLRTFLYLVAVTLGYYFLVALGLLSPWIFYRAKGSVAGSFYRK
jgi:hypothetical protein